MAARLTRAKKKIAAAGVPFRVPGAGRDAAPSRRGAHASCTSCSPPATRRRPGRRSSATTCSTGPTTWPACCARGSPTTPTSPGCSRSSCSPTRVAATRTGPDGELVLLADQDRSRLGRGDDRRGPGPGPRGADGPAREPLRRARRDRRRPRRRAGAPTTPTGSRSSGSTTCSPRAWPSPGRGAQPGGRRWGSPTVPRPVSPRWTPSPTSPGSPGTATSPPPAGSCCAGPGGPTRRATAFGEAVDAHGERRGARPAGPAARGPDLTST